MLEEKRSHARRTQNAQVHVDVLKASNESIDTSIRYEGAMRDFSSHGIRLHGKHPLVKGSSLVLLVEFELDHAKFNLAGNVMWVTETTENEFIAGLKLDQSCSQDINRWREKFA